MLRIIALVLTPVVPALLYRYIRKKDRRTSRLPSKKYLLGALTGATICTLCIIILEQTWDRVFLPNGIVTLWEELASCIFRAALLEEAVKMLFVKRVIRRNQLKSRIEYILMAGTVGIGYGFIEKLVLGNPMALILNIFLPFHMLFQFLMGDWFYKASLAEAAGDAQGKRTALLKAYFYPFAVHAIWDCALSALGRLLDYEGLGIASLGVLGILALVAAGAVFTVRAVKKAAAIAEEENDGEQSAGGEEASENERQ